LHRQLGCGSLLHELTVDLGVVALESIV
jgi:hypothetical protein